MVKAKEANFVLTLPLRPTEHQLSVLDTQFNVARQLYHLALGEALHRWNSVRHTANSSAASVRCCASSVH